MPQFLTPMLILLSIGYLIDFYDLTIFAVVREQALTSLGVLPEDIMSTSAMIFNVQSLGVFIGGLASGIWGDKIGRMSAVRWGIFIYSTAILLNIFATSVEWFALLRFCAGVGLAGELGASITYLSEMAKPADRAYIGGTVYFFGVLGGIFATVIASFCDWKMVFLIGGISGYGLLLVRLTYADSKIFHAIKSDPAIKRGDLFMMFTTKSVLKRIIMLTFAIVPFWFMAYFVNFAPEIAKQLGFASAINQHISMMCYFLGALNGSYLFPFLAQKLASRKKAIHVAFFIMLSSVTLLGLLQTYEWSYYVILFAIGIACGYPGLYMMLVAESFGTNQRSTGTGLISTFARTSLILINTLVPWAVATCGDFWIGSMLCAGLLFLLAMISFRWLNETHAGSMDFCE